MYQHEAENVTWEMGLRKMTWNEKELLDNILRKCLLYLLACKIVFPNKNEAASLASFKTTLQKYW